MGIRKRQKKFGSEIVCVRYFRLSRGWQLKVIWVGLLKFRMEPEWRCLKLGNYRVGFVGPFRGEVV